MTTANSAITSALRLIGVVAKDEAMDAQDADNGLQAMNHMMHGWKARGVDVGHVDLALEGDIQLDDMFIEDLIYLLAVRLAGEYGVSRPQPDGIDHMQGLRNTYTILGVSTVDAGLLRLPSQFSPNYRSR